MDFLLLLFPLLLLAVLWFAMVRPVRQRQKEAEAAQASVYEGAQIMTTAGIYGHVVWLSEDAMGLQISDGVVVKYARAAVATVFDAEGHEG